MRQRLFGIFLVLLGLGLGRASSNYTLVINGHASRASVIHEQDQVLVPLTLPAELENQEWTVSVQRNDESRRVEVSLHPIKKRTRSGDPCYYCSGTGDCAQDSPAGSGLNYSGKAEYFCNGTGRCYHCGGRGRP